MAFSCTFQTEAAGFFRTRCSTRCWKERLRSEVFSLARAEGTTKAKTAGTGTVAEWCREKRGCIRSVKLRT